MNPARAMGLFLRTWRAEWAGLSRGQLAIALDGRLGGRRRVTERVVQKWEAGQPPASADELLALCGLMQRKGLTPVEAEQFRQAVLVGCSAHHYPELFPNEDLAYRDDVAQVAQAVREGRSLGGAAASLVCLVAYARELEAALADTARPTNTRQRSRQQVALAWLWSALTCRHYASGRFVSAARVAAANAEHLARHFGPSGVCWCLTPYTESFWGAMAMHESTQDPSVRLVWVRRYLDLFRESTAAGDEWTALKALEGAVSDTWVLSEAEAAHLLEIAEPLAERFHALFGDEEPGWSGACLLACMRLGLNDRGAAYLADLEPLKKSRDKPDGAVLYRGWLYGAGDWTRHCGDYRAAVDYYTEALDLDRSAGNVPGVQRATVGLGKCERAASKGRTISLPK